jgi:hypothetical protein
MPTAHPGLGQRRLRRSPDLVMRTLRARFLESLGQIGGMQLTERVNGRDAKLALDLVGDRRRARVCEARQPLERALGAQAPEGARRGDADVEILASIVDAIA